MQPLSVKTIFEQLHDRSTWPEPPARALLGPPTWTELHPPTFADLRPPVLVPVSLDDLPPTRADLARCEPLGRCQNSRRALRRAAVTLHLQRAKIQDGGVLTENDQHRAIAAEIGTSHQTVARAHQRMKDAGDVTGDEVTVPPPRDRMAWVLQVLASNSKASPAQKDKIARAMAKHFHRRRR